MALHTEIHPPHPSVCAGVSAPAPTVDHEADGGPLSLGAAADPAGVAPPVGPLQPRQGQQTVEQHVVLVLHDALPDGAAAVVLGGGGRGGGGDE